MLWEGPAIRRPCSLSAQAPSLPLRLQKSKDVALTDWSLDVADQGTPGKLRGSLHHELNPDLDDASAQPGAAEDLLHLCELGCIGVHGGYGLGLWLASGAGSLDGLRGSQL